MKAPALFLLPLLGAVMLSALPSHAAERPAFSMTMSQTLNDLGTHEIATREVDGLTITYPTDEADVVERLLWDIANYRARRRDEAKTEANAIVTAVSDDSVREGYQRYIPRLLGLQSGNEETFQATYDAVVKEVTDLTRVWEQWSGNLSSLQFWNTLTGQSFQQGEQTVFPEISYAGDPKDSGSKFTVHPSFLDWQYGVEWRSLPKSANDIASVVTPFRLDIPLFYAPGLSAETIAANKREFFDRLANLMQSNIAMQLGVLTQQHLIEELLDSQISAHFFTEELAATPHGAMLIRALARYYLVVYLRLTKTITSENASQILSRLLQFDLPGNSPAHPEARVEFARDFDALDPFSGNVERDNSYSDKLLIAGSRLAALMFVRLLEEGPDKTPILQKLRGLGRIPEGGFQSVTAFAEALEAAYPSSIQKTLLGARTHLADTIRSRKAHAAPKVEPAPNAVVENQLLPERETQVFDGITITHPPALRDAIAKLGPELGAARKQARKRIEERISKWTADRPVPIADETLEFIRSNGLEVTRESADSFSSQAAGLSNGRPAMVKHIFEFDTVQIWFKDELRTIFKGGGNVPGFSYDPATDSGTFSYTYSKKLKAEAGNAPAPNPAEDASASAAFPPPIVLKDRSIIDLKDVDAQVAIIRGADKYVLPFFESADTAIPEKLGSSEHAESEGGLLTPAQSLFMSIHELVERDLVTHVIASPDRRWFCDGMANLLAIRACDRQLGQNGDDTGLKIFESLYDPDALSKLAPEVHLLDWPASGNESAAEKNDPGLTAARYYFATRVLIEATAGRDNDFVKTWIAKIRETPWNRTSATTIIAAYDALTGDSLREIIDRTVAVAPKSSENAGQPK